MPHLFLDRLEGEVKLAIWVLLLVFAYLLILGDYRGYATARAVEDDGPAIKFQDRLEPDPLPATAPAAKREVLGCPNTAVEDAGEIYEFFGVPRECVV